MDRDKWIWEVNLTMCEKYYLQMVDSTIYEAFVQFKELDQFT